MGFWCKAAEGYWVFSSGLTVLLHFRPSTGGFRCALPREWRSGGDSLEWNYLRLNPLENLLRVDLRPFPPQGCLLLGAADVVRASTGGAGGFLRHSRGARGVVPAQRCWVGVGCGWREHSLVWNQETGGGGGPTGGVVARSPVQNPGSESRRSLGQRLGGEILLVP